MVVKTYIKSDIKGLWSSSILLNFLTFYQIFCHGLQMKYFVGKNTLNLPKIKKLNSLRHCVRQRIRLYRSYMHSLFLHELRKNCMDKYNQDRPDKINSQQKHYIWIVYKGMQSSKPNMINSQQKHYIWIVYKGMQSS